MSCKALIPQVSFSSCPDVAGWRRLGVVALVSTTLPAFSSIPSLTTRSEPQSFKFKVVGMWETPLQQRHGWDCRRASLPRWASECGSPQVKHAKSDPLHSFLRMSPEDLRNHLCVFVAFRLLTTLWERAFSPSSNETGLTPRTSS